MLRFHSLDKELGNFCLFKELQGRKEYVLCVKGGENTYFLSAIENFISSLKKNLAGTVKLWEKEDHL